MTTDGGRTPDVNRLAATLHAQVLAADRDGTAADNMQTCIDLGYPLQAVETAVDFLGVDGLDAPVLTSLLRLVGCPDQSRAPAVTA